MCGRFARTSSVETFAKLFDASAIDDLAPTYNIAPTHELLLARSAPDGHRELVTLHWGLVPHWSQGPDPKYAMINARADSVATKPAYRDAFKRRRCLIAADGFFEWKQTGKTKQPYFVRLRGGQPFAFAGLWDRWAAAGQVPIDSCTIITCNANPLVAEIHERMPVILPPRLYDAWMNPDQKSTNALTALLKPYPDLLMEAYPVGLAVNSPKNDSAGLVRPIDTHTNTPN
jgi:putative SOS response-associated peptidase YedK